MKVLHKNPDNSQESFAFLFQEHPLFSKFMNPFTLKLILENAKIVTQKAGAAPLYGPGQKSLCFYIVMRGWMAIDGPQGSCGEYGLGAIIGEEWLYSKSYSSRQNTAFCPQGAPT